MDYDDSYEEFSMMDFVDEIYETMDLHEDEDDERTFTAFLNSDWDF